jgi:hypothetical protein
VYLERDDAEKDTVVGKEEYTNLCQNREAEKQKKTRERERDIPAAPLQPSKKFFLLLFREDQQIRQWCLPCLCSIFPIHHHHHLKTCGIMKRSFTNGEVSSSCL